VDDLAADRVGGDTGRHLQLEAIHVGAELLVENTLAVGVVKLDDLFKSVRAAGWWLAKMGRTPPLLGTLVTRIWPESPNMRCISTKSFSLPRTRTWLTAFHG